MSKIKVLKALQVLNEACEEMKDGDCPDCMYQNLCGQAWVCYSEDRNIDGLKKKGE